VERLYIIAGEASGDLHGAALVRALRERRPELQVRGWGGDQMAAAGCTVVKHYRDLAFMGFVEVLRNLRTIRGNFAFARQDIAAFRPDTLIFIDYPGFNLRLLPWVKRQGIRTVWYIAPQVWAWHQSRVRLLKQYVDELLVILPFEKAFFEEQGMHCHFVGHPLAHRIAAYRPDPEFALRHGLDRQRPLIALLPGSRSQEIRGMLPVMMEVARARPDLQWALAAAPSQPDDLYLALIPPEIPLVIVRNATYDLLAHARAAMVTSGTATLETALFGVPQVVVYKGNPLSFQIARRMIRVRYISLVNLLLDRPLVRELIQGELRVPKLREALEELLDPDCAARIREGYDALRQSLAGSDASARAAEIILREPTISEEDQR
jgi:lipid-A-disaccharide synthase